MQAHVIDVSALQVIAFAVIFSAALVLGVWAAHRVQK